MATISFATASFLLRHQISSPNAVFFTSPLHGGPKSLSSENRAARLLRKPLSRRLSAIEFEELVEKDWSFLDPSSSENSSDLLTKLDRIIVAADIGAQSRVLACFPTADFIDHLIETRPCELLIATHESLFLLAEIKERQDSVRCWQGGVDAVPERLLPLTAAFICYFPAMGVSIDQLLKSLARSCSPGGRVVIACEQGREGVKIHREEHSDVVKSDLPERSSLERAADKNSFRIVELVDESSLYLAVLELSTSTTAS